MDKHILELRYLRNNTELQCIPTTLFVILKNQFEKDKRVHINQITYKNLKKWVDWGDKSHRRPMFSSEKDKRYYDELFHGNFNIDTFHIELNQHIKKWNLKLEFKYGFTSNDIREKIKKGVYPMFLINPKYIEFANYNNPTRKKIRGEPADVHHFIAVYGYIDEDFCAYDSDLQHNPSEILSEANIKCKTNFANLQNHSKDINNRLYWFELIDKSETTTLSPFQK